MASTNTYWKSLYDAVICDIPFAVICHGCSKSSLVALKGYCRRYCDKWCWKAEMNDIAKEDFICPFIEMHDECPSCHNDRAVSIHRSKYNTYRK
jgi:hypothetical protein